MSEISGWLTQFFRDRTATPLFPTFIWSWVLINWRVIYVTLFFSHENLPELAPNKISYIENQLTWCSNLILPLLTTAIILGPVQWLGNQTYRISLFFKSKRLILKNWKLNRNRMFTKVQVSEMMKAQQEINDRQATTLIEYSKIVEQAQANYNTLSSASSSFKVIAGHYGSVNRFVDVTRYIAALGANEGQIIIGNDELGGDPYPGVVKTLIVHYRNEGKDETVVCLEDDHFKFTKGNVEIVEGKHSKAMREDLEKNLKAIEEQKNKNS